MKNFEIGQLLDFYGEFLTQRQSYLLDLHFNNDLSLFEIAQKENISRQGVHDAIQKGERALQKAEERLKLVKKNNSLQKQFASLESAIKVFEEKLVLQEQKQEFSNIIKLITQIKKTI